MMVRSGIQRLPVLLLLVNLSVARADQLYEVDAVGRGQTLNAARLAAQRKALEAILDKASAKVSRETEAFWIRRLVLAHPEVVIQDDYKVRSRRSAAENDFDGQHVIEITVRLPASRLERARQQAAHFAKTIGEPTIMVIIQDRIEDRRPFTSTRIQDPDSSDVAQAMMERLNAEQFRVIVKRQSEVLKRNDLSMAELRGDDLRVIQAIAQKHGAHIIVSGYGRAQGPLRDTRSIPSVQMWTWSGDAKCDVYWADDASLITTKRAVAKQADEDPDHGAIRCLQKVGDALASEVSEAVFQAFGDRAAEGRPVSIEIYNCMEDELDAVSDAIAQKWGSDAVLSSTFNNGLGEIRLKSGATASELRRQIRALPLDGFKLETYRNEPNSMQFRVVR